MFDKKINEIDRIPKRISDPKSNMRKFNRRTKKMKRGKNKQGESLNRYRYIPRDDIINLYNIERK